MINLTSIITRSVIKMFKLTFIKSVDISEIKMKKTQKKTFEKDEKNLIYNIII